MSDWLCVLLVFVITFAGSFVQNIAGFGFVIMCMAFFPMFLPIGTCLVAAQAGGAMLSLVMLFGRFHEIKWSYAAPPVIGASAASLLGLVFLGGIGAEAYMVALGVLLVLLAVWMWRLSDRVKIKPSPVSGGICGALGGLMGSVFGVSVPPIVLYYTSNMGEDKDGYMAPLQITLFMQTAVCLAGRAALGMWPAGAWPLIAAAAAGLLLGKIPGSRIYGRLDVKRLRTIIYIFIALLGLYTIFSNI